MLDSEERGKRITAAYCYGKISQQTLAEKLGMSDRKLRRLESGDGEISLDLCWEIADICGLPRAWFQVDFNRLPELLDDNEPVALLKVNQLERDVAELADQLRELVQGRQPGRRES